MTSGSGAGVAGNRGGGLHPPKRRVLAAEGFHTAAYDLAIAGWFADVLGLEDVRETRWMTPQAPQDAAF